MNSKRWTEIQALNADVIAGRIHVRFDEETAWLAIVDLRREVEDLRKMASALADASVYHDSRGGMLIVDDPDAHVAKARALLEASDDNGH